MLPFRSRGRIQSEGSVFVDAGCIPANSEPSAVASSSLRYKSKTPCWRNKTGYCKSVLILLKLSMILQSVSWRASRFCPRSSRLSVRSLRILVMVHTRIPSRRTVIPKMQTATDKIRTCFFTGSGYNDPSFLPVRMGRSFLPNNSTSPLMPPARPGVLSFPLLSLPAARGRMWVVERG